jgi:hypothetical protein
MDSAEPAGGHLAKFGENGEGTSLNLSAGNLAKLAMRVNHG